MNEISIHMNMPGASSDIANLFLSSAEYSSLRIRYISIQDKENSTRKTWLDQALLHYSMMDFSSRPDILMSTAQMDFDVVIFGGEDSRRLADFIKEYGSMMVNKPKICICGRSDPKRRAKLIMAGFDDVIDVHRMHQIEFIARLYAIWRRYHHNENARLQDNEFSGLMARVAYMSKLPNKQRAVLAHLLKSPGYSATYHSLRIAASSDTVPISAANLKVIISHLRKFLRPGFSIKSDRHASYRLVFPRVAPSKSGV